MKFDHLTEAQRELIKFTEGHSQIPSTIPEGLTDWIANKSDQIDVDIQHEAGGFGTFKIYIHVNGETRFRVCKVKGRVLIDGKVVKIL